MKSNFLTKGIILFLALITVIVMTGCNDDETPEPDSPGQEGQAAPQELIIGENIDLGGYDPVKDMSAFVRFLVYDSLVELGYDYEQVPGLATDWDMSEDGKTWTFQLREGVTFHDGEAWNAEAARINFQARKDAGTAGFYQDIESLETPDEFTFVVNFATPLFTFASDITQPTYGMVSPKAFDENNEVIEAIGTGPFELESWQKDSEFVMVANENFYEEVPALKKVTFKVITDGTARAMALEAGEVDMMSGRNALTVLEGLQANEDVQVIKTMGQTSEIVMMNTFDDVLSDLNIRKAIAASAGFAEAVPGLLSDLAEPAENFFSPVFGKYVDPELTLPAYDIDFAKESLKNAGYTETDGDGYVVKDGERLTLELIVDSKNEEDKALATVMKGNLKEVGIEIDITMLETAMISERLPAHDYQLAMQGQVYVPTDDPSVHYKNGYYHSGSYHNMYSTPELDEKVDRLFDSVDGDERLSLHKELQREITAEVPVIMMFHRNNVIFANNKLKDYEVAKGTWQIYKGLEKAYIE